MRKTIRLAAAVALITFSCTAHSMAATSKGGHPACLKEEWHKDMTAFVIAKDKASFEAYINSNKCVILKEGLRVTVTDSPGMFGLRVEFAFKGVKFWTYRDALNYGN